MLSQQLWHSHQDLVQACLEHPFVRGIATGGLKRDCFAFYVGQDTFFLESFARAYSIADAKAPDWQGFTSFHQLATGVLNELKLHENYALQWGIDLGKIQPAHATRRYTDFLLATAWMGDIGAIAVAMSPCMRLYAYLGQQLALEPISENPYQAWIDSYSGDEFAALASQLEELADKYALMTENISLSYRYALSCEQDFFSAALIQGKS